MSSKNPVIVVPTGQHTSTFIFMHGLGDTGHGWSSSLAALKSNNCKLICPTAAKMPVTLNGGMEMPSWFDLKSLDPNTPEDEAGIRRAAQVIQGLIDKEISSGIPAERIVIGGFSQGGALALHVGLTGPTKLAAIVVLSGWLPLHRQIMLDLNTINKIPVLHCHGQSDPLVQFAFGSLSYDLLKGPLPGYQFKAYPRLGHSSCPEELDEVKAFLQTVLP